MSFNRENLPDPESFYKDNLQKVTLRKNQGKGCCPFHEERTPSFSFNTVSGAFYCFGCGVHGGDILSFVMQRDGIEFIEAAKQLGAWINDGKGESRKPTPISARDALYVLNMETLIIATAGANIANNIKLTNQDLKRLLQAANRIIKVRSIFQ